MSENTIAKFEGGPCIICRAKVKKGDLIGKYRGSWLHADCIKVGKAMAELITNVEELHREALGVDKITYSVSYSIADAMGYGLSNGLVEEADVSQIRNSRIYGPIWRYVAD